MHKVDLNQKRIVACLRAAGASVLDMSSLGGGAPDLLCAYAGKSFLLEVKNPRKNGGRGLRYTDAQRDFFLRWQAPIYTVCDERQALDILDGQAD